MYLLYMEQWGLVRVFMLNCPYNRRWWVYGPWEKVAGAWWSLCCTSTEAGVSSGHVSEMLFWFKTREGLEHDSARFPVGQIWVPSYWLRWHLQLKQELKGICAGWGQKSTQHSGVFQRQLHGVEYVHSPNLWQYLWPSTVRGLNQKQQSCSVSLVLWLFFFFSSMNLISCF